MSELDATAGGKPDGFAEAFTSKLEALNETQQSINQLSCWLRFQHKKSQQAAQIWASSAVKAPESRQLLFVYLLNDVLQTSRRRLPELCDHFGAKMEQVLPTLYKVSTPQVRDKISRVINVWEERAVLAAPEVARLRAIMAGGAGPAAPGAPLPPHAAAPVGRGAGGEAASLGPCLEALQSSDVLDRTLASMQTDSNLAQVLRDEPVDDPSHLGVALGRADAAHALVVENNAALQSELEDRKRLILLLCTAVEQQDAVCSELEAAMEQGNATLARVVETRTRLDNVRARCARAARREDPAPRQLGNRPPRAPTRLTRPRARPRDVLRCRCFSRARRCRASSTPSRGWPPTEAELCHVICALDHVTIQRQASGGAKLYVFMHAVVCRRSNGQHAARC